MRAYTDEDLRKYHKEPQRLQDLFEIVERTAAARPGFLFLGGPQSVSSSWYRYAKPKRELLALAAPSCSNGIVTSFEIIPWERGPLVLFARGAFGSVLVCELRPGSEHELFAPEITYKAIFDGRKIGAIGVSGSITTEVKGENPEHARLKLYDRFDHIHQLKLTPVEA